MPRFMPGWFWKQQPVPMSTVPEKPQQTPKSASRTIQGKKDEEYQIVLKRKGPNPTWLAKHQAKFAKATSQAAAETKHLSGTERVQTMHQLVSKYMLGDK